MWHVESWFQIWDSQNLTFVSQSMGGRLRLKRFLNHWQWRSQTSSSTWAHLGHSSNSPTPKALNYRGLSFSNRGLAPAGPPPPPGYATDHWGSYIGAVGIQGATVFIPAIRTCLLVLKTVSTGHFIDVMVERRMLFTTFGIN